MGRKKYNSVALENTQGGCLGSAWNSKKKKRPKHTIQQNADIPLLINDEMKILKAGLPLSLLMLNIKSLPNIQLPPLKPSARSEHAQSQ